MERPKTFASHSRSALTFHSNSRFRRRARLGSTVKPLREHRHHWGLVVSAIMFSVVWFGGDALIAVMTASPEVQAGAHEFLIFAAVAAFTGMPAFVMDGVMSGATLNTIIRNGMVASFAIYFAAALLLQQAFGVAGLWIAINLFFVVRATIFLIATRSKLRALFA